MKDICSVLSHDDVADLAVKLLHSTHNCDVFAFEHDLAELFGGFGLGVAELG
jgi:hypothetical protein